jgi:hypothetical protein
MNNINNIKIFEEIDNYLELNNIELNNNNKNNLLKHLYDMYDIKLNDLIAIIENYINVKKTKEIYDCISDVFHNENYDILDFDKKILLIRNNLNKIGKNINYNDVYKYINEYKNSLIYFEEKNNDLEKITEHQKYLNNYKKNYIYNGINNPYLNIYDISYLPKENVLQNMNKEIRNDLELSYLINNNNQSLKKNINYKIDEIIENDDNKKKEKILNKFQNKNIKNYQNITGVPVLDNILSKHNYLNLTYAQLNKLLQDKLNIDERASYNIIEEYDIFFKDKNDINFIESRNLLYNQFNKNILKDNENINDFNNNENKINNIKLEKIEAIEKKDIEDEILNDLGDEEDEDEDFDYKNEDEEEEDLLIDAGKVKEYFKKKKNNNNKKIKQNKQNKLNKYDIIIENIIKQNNKKKITLNELNEIFTLNKIPKRYLKQKDIQEIIKYNKEYIKNNKKKTYVSKNDIKNDNKLEDRFQEIIDYIEKENKFNISKIIRNPNLIDTNLAEFKQNIEMLYHMDKNKLNEFINKFKEKLDMDQIDYNNDEYDTDYLNNMLRTSIHPFNKQKNDQNDQNDINEKINEIKEMIQNNTLSKEDGLKFIDLFKNISKNQLEKIDTNVLKTENINEKLDIKKDNENKNFFNKILNIFSNSINSDDFQKNIKKNNIDIDDSDNKIGDFLINFLLKNN